MCTVLVYKREIFLGKVGINLIRITQDDICRLFDDYADMAYRISLNILRNREEAQDVVMDVFTALLSRAAFDSEEHIKAWLIRTAENKSINVVKSSRLRKNISMEDVLEGTLSVPFNESESDVMDMVMRLPDKLKTTVYMFYYEDMSAARIAEILGISENTVYKRLERGRGILKLNLEGDAI